MFPSPEATWLSDRRPTRAARLVVPASLAHLFSLNPANTIRSARSRG